MAYEESIRSISLTAGEALTQYVAVVTESGSGDALEAGAADADVVGITQEDASDGDTVQVALPGCVTKWVAGGDVTQGGPVTTDASGRCVDATSTDPIYGYCLNDPAAADEIASVLYTGHQGTEA